LGGVRGIKTLIKRKKKMGLGESGIAVVHAGWGRDKNSQKLI